MPYETSIERLAREEGRQEGREEGREEGRQEGREEARGELLAIIQAILKNKFGAAGSQLITKIRAIEDLHRLHILILEIVTAEALQSICDSLAASNKEAVQPGHNASPLVKE